ncbi:MAG: YfiT family bacillithiol transferase [Gemmatimonadota bacterium]
MSTNTNDLAYPIGGFTPRPSSSAAERNADIAAIEAAPRQLRAAVAGLGEQQLDTPYRPGGWTVREVAHHVADSHANAYIRVKLALTEENPVIKPYDESAWARLDDTRKLPVGISLSMLDSITERFVVILRSLGDTGFARTYRHPETGEHDLNYLVAMYAWHGRHHVAHITGLRERMRWGSA